MEVISGEYWERYLFRNIFFEKWNFAVFRFSLIQIFLRNLTENSKKNLTKSSKNLTKSSKKLTKSSKKLNERKKTERKNLSSVNVSSFDNPINLASQTWMLLATVNRAHEAKGVNEAESSIKRNLRWSTKSSTLSFAFQFPYIHQNHFRSTLVYSRVRRRKRAWCEEENLPYKEREKSFMDFLPSGFKRDKVVGRQENVIEAVEWKFPDPPYHAYGNDFEKFSPPCEN